VVSLLATPAVVRAAHARKLYDLPTEARRIHTRPIPRLGGIAVFAATMCALITAVATGSLDPRATSETGRFALGILLGGGLLFLAGLWDDMWGLRPIAKLLAQLSAAGIAFWFGFRIDLVGLGSTEFVLGWLALPVTILWVVGVTNAFNLIDGLDGLATGIAIVALATTLAIALALGNPEVATVCAALLGAPVGFLRYNFNPARIFLGDSGSLYVGFMLAVLSVHGSVKSATAVLVIVPLFALAIPLLDTTLAILRRWLRGVPLSGADSRHIHHQLLALGLTHRRAAVTLYAVATALAMFGLLVALAPPTLVVGIAVAGGALSLVLLLYGMRQLAYHEFAEAGVVLASGFVRIRRIIQDQIHARDLAQMLEQAGSFTQLDRLLEIQGSAFGFLGMEVCRESSVCRKRLADERGITARAWKVDYPVSARQSIHDDPYVLRIWCSMEQGYRPFGAERVARVVAPAVEAWLIRAGLVVSPATTQMQTSDRFQGADARRVASRGVAWDRDAADGSAILPLSSDHRVSEAVATSRKGVAGH
jgi:UDP-GlcNAc:undecaprenyl-phosphate/decaprenyl-phosphate GlcNAc-1-phosphate transferase